MKKILVISAILISSATIMAQGNVSLVRVEGSIGFFTLYDQIISDNSYDPYYYGEPAFAFESTQPAFFMGISFYSYKKLEIGVEAGYQHASTTDYYYYDPINSIPSSENVTLDAITFTPKVRLNWVRSDDNLFEFYSAASVGLAFLNYNYEKSTSENGMRAQPTGHLCFAGIRFGNKWGGALELGVGSKGLINFGLSYRP